MFVDRSSTTLRLRQEAPLKVESNLSSSEKLKASSERRKRSEEASSSSNSNQKVDKLTNMLETLTSEMSKIKINSKPPGKGRNQNQNDYPDRNHNQNDSPNRNQNWRRNNQQVQLMQREKNPTDEQKNRAPCQNTVLDREDEEEIQELEDDIHCVVAGGEHIILTEAGYYGSLFYHLMNVRYQYHSML